MSELLLVIFLLHNFQNPRQFFACKQVLLQINRSVPPLEGGSEGAMHVP